MTRCNCIQDKLCGIISVSSTIFYCNSNVSNSIVWAHRRTEPSEVRNCDIAPYREMGPIEGKVTVTRTTISPMSPPMISHGHIVIKLFSDLKLT